MYAERVLLLYNATPFSLSLTILILKLSNTDWTFTIFLGVRPLTWKPSNGRLGGFGSRDEPLPKTQSSSGLLSGSPWKKKTFKFLVRGFSKGRHTFWNGHTNKKARLITRKFQIGSILSSKAKLHLLFIFLMREPCSLSCNIVFFLLSSSSIFIFLSFSHTLKPHK